jgi:hypothetical protein
VTEAEDCRRGASGGIGKMPTAECTSRSGDQHFTQRLRTAVAATRVERDSAICASLLFVPSMLRSTRLILVLSFHLCWTHWIKRWPEPPSVEFPYGVRLIGGVRDDCHNYHKHHPAAMRPLSRIREVRNLLNGYAPLVAHTVGLNSCRSMNGQCGHSGPKAARSGASP